MTLVLRPVRTRARSDLDYLELDSIWIRSCPHLLNCLVRIARSRGAVQALSNKIIICIACTAAMFDGIGAVQALSNKIIICIACTAAMFDGIHGLRGKRQSFFQRLPCSSPPHPADSVRPQLPTPPPKPSSLLRSIKRLLTC